MPPQSKRTSVFPLPPRGAQEAERVCLLRDVADALDGVLDALVDVHGSPHWSAREWSVAAMPFRVRVPQVEGQLRRLAQVELTEWPDFGWALTLDQTRARTEKELSRTDAALAALLRPRCPPGERVRWSRSFVAGRDAAIDALSSMRDLLAAWCLMPQSDN
jgi:hypothetical protein